MPERTCIGCRSKRPQAQLVRCALGPRGATVSRTAAGRGAWLCSYECFLTAERRRAFDRAWRTPTPADVMRGLDQPVRAAFGGVDIRMEESPTRKG